MLTSNFGLLIKLQIAILKQQAIHLLILICILINASAVIAGPAEDTETLLNWAEKHLSSIISFPPSNSK